MNRRVPFIPSDMPVCLGLKDDTTWSIIAGDERASITVTRLAAAMQLSPTSRNSSLLKKKRGTSRFLHPDCRLLVLVDLNRAAGSVLSSKDGSIITCVLGPAHSEEILVMQLIRLSAVISLYAESRRGLMLHGALVEKDGCGVILAGPGGRGKTTASQRLVLPWRSLSDDATLVVCDKKGTYWAHPWPTWSNFLFGGLGGSWSVQNAVPLRGIFFLEQTEEDQFEPLGKAKAVSLLIESAEQILSPMLRYMEKNELRLNRLQRFENICTIVKAVPSYVLCLGRDGTFWKELERALND